MLIKLVEFIVITNLVSTEILPNMSGVILLVEELTALCVVCVGVHPSEE